MARRTKSSLNVSQEELAKRIYEKFFEKKLSGKKKAASVLIDPVVAGSIAGTFGITDYSEVQAFLREILRLNGYVYNDLLFSVSQSDKGYTISVKPYQPELPKSQRTKAPTQTVGAVSIDLDPLVKAMENLLNAIAQQNQVITQMLQLLTEQMRRSEVYLRILDEAYGLSKKYEEA